MQSDQKKKIGRIIGLAAGGLVLITAAIVLFMVFTGGTSITGPWHSEELKQQLRFHDDDTVVIRTQYGDYEASYTFDSKSGSGTITMNDKSLRFSVQDDSMLLTSEDVQSAFVRGEMAIPAVAEASPLVTQTAALTQTPVTTQTAAVTASPTATPPPTATPSPMATPSSAATRKPKTSAPAVKTPTPKPSPGVSPTQAPTVQPTATINLITIITNPGDAILKLISSSVVGTWQNTSDSSNKLTFKSDYTYEQYVNAKKTASGSYTYNPLTGKGSLGTNKAFTVSGNTLTMNDGSGAIYKRQ